MRGTGHQRSAAVDTTLITPSVDAPCHDLAAPPNATAVLPAMDTITDEVLRAPTATPDRRGAAAGVSADRARQLVAIIRQRIESRLGGRVRGLVIQVVGNRIILEGRCATYYTKQLAQHAALGVLEDELLENNIAVAVPR